MIRYLLLSIALCMVKWVLVLLVARAIVGGFSFEDRNVVFCQRKIVSTYKLRLLEFFIITVT